MRTRRELMQSGWISRCLWLGAFCLLTVACASTRTGGAGASAEYAEADYREAMEDLASGAYPDALALFQQVSKAPRYVKWSSLAQLRVGDTLYFQGKYAEAAQQFAAFIAQNEGDTNIPYASYMVARAYYEQVPTDWFLTPPAYENDRQSLERCRRELRQFVTRYPRSRFLPDVRDMLATVEAMEYGFNEYVASYYEGRDKPGGVAVRLKHMMETWPQVANTVDNVARLALAYEQLDRNDDALRTYRDGLSRHPHGSHVPRWSRRIEQLGAEPTPEEGADESPSSSIPQEPVEPGDDDK